MNTQDSDCSFYIDDYVTELKVHLNLSEKAWLIIEGDIKNFYDSKEKESTSGFFNRIFSNFYQLAHATISLRLMEKDEELNKLYSSTEFSSINKGTISLFIQKSKNVYKTKLIEETHSYPSGHGEKIRINKGNLDILRESVEANYYGETISRYLKAIFEEYVTKDSNIREQIFFNETINKISLAISEQRKLKITLDEKLTVTGFKKKPRKFYVSPYKIVQDKTNTFNYLIGYSEEINDVITTDENGKKTKTQFTSDKIVSCFRISRINKIDIQSSMGAKISKEHANELEEMLNKRTPMYMSGEPIDVKIKFTDKGLESLKRQIYMRPQIYDIDPTDKHKYIFHCTELQILNYFFKFGWDAQVIEPTYLSNKMKSRYERALKAYQGMSKEEIFNSEKVPERNE